MNKNNRKIYILSDKKGIGKTTSLQEWIKFNSNLKGFLSPIIDGKRMFQIIETNSFIPMETNSEGLEVGKYIFDRSSFEFVENTVLDLFQNKENTTIILDEIGPLEIYKNKGFHELVLELTSPSIDSPSSLFFVVRESCLEDFLYKYQLTHTEVYNLKEFKHKFNTRK